MKQWTFPTDEQINKVLRADLISVDIETYDPDLRDKGPSMYRGDGMITGVSFACKNANDESTAFYLPLVHENVTVDTTYKSIDAINRLMSTTTPKVGANIMYDLEWLKNQDFKVADCQVHDIQFAEPLLDEYARTYSLAKLATKYTNEVKLSNVLEDFRQRAGWTVAPITQMHKVPVDVAAEYATQDAVLPLEIFEKQKVLLKTQRLWDVYLMETALIPLLLQMRRQGVRINVPLLHKTIIAATDRRFNHAEAIFDWAGQEFNVGSTTQLSKIFDKKGIRYPRNPPTEKMLKAGKHGNPNLDAEFLTALACSEPIANEILNFRHFNTMINMFLHTYIDMNVNGRIHASFHPLRSDEFGTVSGRFSMSKPNLQQVSAKELKEEYRDEFFSGKILRRMFVPEEGHLWAKLDYSQIEYRILAHYADEKAGGAALRTQYNDDPDTDFHKYIQDGMGVDRRTAKRFNFGSIYGMGAATTARKFGYTIEEAESLHAHYHRTACYIRPTRKKVLEVAKRRGFIFTLLGRKARVHHSRKLHSLFNRLIQGTAADIAKKSLVDAYNAGVFDVLKPHFPVHDEIDVSFKDTPEHHDALCELKHIMENTVKLKVPIKVDCHIGNNWEQAD